MSEPALHQVQGNAFLDTGHAEAMPQALWGRVRAVDACLPHDFDHSRIGGFQAPGPETFTGSAFTDAVCQVQRIKQGRRHGYSAVDALTVFLLALEGKRPCLKVYPVRCQGQGLRGPAPGIQQCPAVGPHFPVRLRFCGLPERLALRAGKIEPVAVIVVQAHSGGCGGGSFLHSLFLGRHGDSDILLDERFTDYSGIFGKSRQAVNGKTLLRAGARADLAAPVTENWQFSVNSHYESPPTLDERGEDHRTT